jgi:hypothetical protein
MNNPALPYPILQPTGAHKACRRTNATLPIHNYPSEDYSSQQSQRMTSTSEEEEEETQNNSKNEWQVIRRTKRKKLNRTQHNNLVTKVETHNLYGLLTNETMRIPLTEIQVQRKSTNLLQYSYMVL